MSSLQGFWEGKGESDPNPNPKSMETEEQSKKISRWWHRARLCPGYKL